MRFRQSATKYREVLAVHKYQTAVDHAVAGDHTIARNFVVLHTKVGAAVLHKHVPFFKGAFV